jgi:iron complex outermembrane receptor protein
MMAILVCHVIFLGLTSYGLAADDHPSNRATGEEDVLSFDGIVVRGEVVNRDLEATSATILTNEDIVQRVFITPLDIVALSPGVAIHQYKQGGTAANFSLRGFIGNSHGSNTAIFLDGIPLNEGDGYADTNIINPLEIEKVELIKGPTSALYGNYASAGALAFYTKKQVDGNRLKFNTGAYNTYEANFVGGLSTVDWDQVYSIQTYHTDGYQDNSDWDRQNAAVRFTRHLTDNLDVRLSLRGFNSDWDAPGYINQTQYDQEPTQAVSTTNGGGKDRVAARIDMDYQIHTDSKVLLYIWGYDQEFWRWYADDPIGLTPGSIVGNLRNFNRNVYGAGVSYNFMGDVLHHRMRFTFGCDYMLEDIGRERWRLLSDTGREKGPKYWDYDIDMETLAFYAQGSYQIAEPLRFILGARYDQFSGDLIDHLDNDISYSMKDQDIFSPKAGLILTILDDRLDLFATYSEGFALLPGFSEQAAFKQDHWDPQRRTQYESGTRIRPTDWLEAEIIAFHLETSKDFIYDSSTDEYQNIGETTREGIEVEADFHLFDFGYFHADYGYVDANYDQYVSSGVSLNGKKLRGIPENIYNAEIGYRPNIGLGGKLRYHYEEGYYLDDANIFKSESWDRLDAQITYRFGHKTEYLIALDIINVLDEKYADYTSGTTEKKYSPSLPLSAYLSFNVNSY